MKIFVILTILILSLTSAANAGLDSDNMPDYVIAVYHFESTKQSDAGVTYSPDSGPRKFHIPFFDGASLTDDGKYGKAVQLRIQASVDGGTWWSATLPNDEFSIVAWLKLPKQAEDVRFYISLLGLIKTDNVEILVSTLTCYVRPDGNIAGAFIDFLRGGAIVLLESENQNVANNQWHHIAFTKYAKTYTLFIDGEDVAENQSVRTPKFLGNLTSIRIDGTRGENLTGNVLVDDVGFFETGFSSYEIKGLYKSQLSTFLEEMSVTPEGRLATTWAELKFQH